MITEAAKRDQTLIDVAVGTKVVSRLAQCKAWLKDYLSMRGEVDAVTLKAAAKEAGYDYATYVNARKKVGCKSENRKAVWWYRLPTEAETEPAAEVKRERFAEYDLGEKCEDRYNVSREERERLGIRKDEQVCWVRGPQWSTFAAGEGPNAWKAGNPGARIIRDPDDNGFVYNGPDLVMGVVPRSVVEAREAEERKICEAIERENAANAQGAPRHDDFDTRDVDRLEMAKRINSQRNRASGLIGPLSPSGGGVLPEEYMRRNGLSESDADREALSYAMHGSYVELNMTDAQVREMIYGNSPDRGGRGQGPRGDNGRYSSAAPTVRPRNLMSDADRAARGIR